MLDALPETELEVDDGAEIRIAKMADADQIVASLRAMNTDNEWGLRHADGRSLTFSEARAHETVRRALVHTTDYDQAWIGIFGPPGEVWGSVYLQEGPAFCSDDRLLFELWNYVLPEHRDHARAGLQLINFATTMAQVLQLPLVIGIMSHIRTEAKRRLYRRALGRGGRSIGEYFLYHATANDVGVAEENNP